MKLEHLTVALNREGSTYLAGEIVNGTLKIGSSKPLRVHRIVVKLTGQVHTGWVRKTSDVIYDSNDQILHEVADLTSYLVKVGDGQVLPVGEHSIRFDISLPMDLISTVQNDYFGWVRYKCTGLIDMVDEDGRFVCVADGRQQLIVDKPLIIYSMLNLDAPHLRTSSTTFDTVELVEHWAGCWRQRTDGVLSARLTVVEQGLLPGETVNLVLTLEELGSIKRRRKNKNNCQELVLCQQLDFRAMNRYQMKLFDRQSQTLNVQSINTCQTTPNAGQLTKLIDFKIPSNLPPTSTQADGLITISYFFKLDMQEFNLILPVVIGTVKTPHRHSHIHQVVKVDD